MRFNLTQFSHFAVIFHRLSFFFCCFLSPPIYIVNVVTFFLHVCVCMCDWNIRFSSAFREKTWYPILFAFVVSFGNFVSFFCLAHFLLPFASKEMGMLISYNHVTTYSRERKFFFSVGITSTSITEMKRTTTEKEKLDWLMWQSERFMVKINPKNYKSSKWIVIFFLQRGK